MRRHMLAQVVGRVDDGAGVVIGLVRLVVAVRGEAGVGGQRRVVQRVVVAISGSGGGGDGGGRLVLVLLLSGGRLMGRIVVGNVISVRIFFGRRKFGIR